MMITGTEIIEIIVTGEVRGIGPWIGESEAAVPTGGDQTAATGRIMTEGGHHPATAATSAAERENGRDIDTGTTEDHHLWKGPTRKSIRDLEVALQAGRRRELVGRRKKTDGVIARAQVKRRTTPQSKKKSQRRLCLTKVRRKMKSFLNLCGFDVPIRKTTTPVTLWTRWETLL